MANGALLIVLLDTLAEFPVNFNQTLQDSLLKRYPNITLKLNQYCDPNITRFVLDKVNYGKPSWKPYDKKSNVVNLKKYFKDGNDVNNLLGNNNSHDYEEINSVESVESFIDLADARRAIDRKDKFENTNQIEIAETSVTNVTSNMTVDVESAPFLVAIFETLSNVTAQTCAGTLLSPRWVITATSCINVLRGLDSDKMNISEFSSYTVVAGSTNPLVDGSIHNVTEVFFSDGNLENRPKKLLTKDSNSSTLNIKSVVPHNCSLVMMRIDPIVTNGGLEIWKENPEIGLDVTVLGWSPIKNDSLDTTRATTVLAKVASSLSCNNVSTSALCLTENGSGNKTQMGSSGGAVLVRSGLRTHILAVLIEDHAPMLAEPLAEHAGWIQRLLSEDIKS